MSHKILAVLVLALIYGVSFALSNTLLAKFHTSPLIISIILGAFFANLFTKQTQILKSSGVIAIAGKQILRLGIILFGFNISLGEIASVGTIGVIYAAFMVFATFCFALFTAKALGLSKDSAVLIGSGASICGAAAVMATQNEIKADANKLAIAICTVVLFGTIGMFIYPFIAKFLALTPQQTGFFIGGSLHEVAHVVAASAAFDSATSSTAVIIKMLRVIMLVPFLFLLNFLNLSQNSDGSKLKSIPWFALFFLVAICVRSLPFFPENLVQILKLAASICLCVAMCALGFGIDRSSIFKATGKKPFLLAFFIFLWLICSSLVFVKTLC
ncbi:putative sulfate exporter family transporter [uncultured Campylobacter sp.]|uniref:YeiH family protein n=1 Tax=uncultured Campylobacter sp. TaxID=218934 RepID=UPI00261D0381|nr:putative sulfate exporter family transporter [uncultured Campylobacter sp.]